MAPTPAAASPPVPAPDPPAAPAPGDPALPPVAAPPVPLLPALPPVEASAPPLGSVNEDEPQATTKTQVAKLVARNEDLTSCIVLSLRHGGSRVSLCSRTPLACVSHGVIGNSNRSRISAYKKH